MSRFSLAEPAHVFLQVYEKAVFCRAMQKTTYMKTILVCFVLLVGGVGAMAQSAADRDAALQATMALKSVYGLSEAQVSQMLVIQERRFRNLAEIEPFKTTDEYLYRQKLRNIRLGTEASIERILSPEQRPILEKERVERRKQEAARLKELQQNGASKQEIMEAMLEIESDH